MASLKKKKSEIIYCALFLQINNKHTEFSNIKGNNEVNQGQKSTTVVIKCSGNDRA